MVKLVYWKYYGVPIRNKNISFYSFSGQGHLSLYPTATLLSKSFWMKEQAEAYQKGEKCPELWAKRMVSTNSTTSR